MISRKGYLLLSFFLVSTLVIAAGGIKEFTQDKLRFGTGTTKELVFDYNEDGSSAKITVDASDQISFNNQVTMDGKFQVVNTDAGSIPCPIMTEVQRDALTPESALCVFNSDTDKLNVYDATASTWRVVGEGGAGGSRLNLLQDGSFEDESVTEYVCASCTITYDETEVLKTPNNTKALKIVTTAAAQNFIVDKATNAQWTDATPIIKSVWIKTTATDIKFKSRAAGADIADEELSVIGDGNWHIYKIPTVGNTTSLGYALEIPTGTSTVYVDETEIRGQVSSDTASISSKTDGIAYTPTVYGFGTVSGLEAEYNIDGEYVYVSGKFTAGTPTGDAAAVSLPNNYLINNNNISAARIIGQAGRAVADQNNSDFSVVARVTSSDRVYFGMYNNSTYSSFDEVPANQLVGSGNIFGFSFRVKVQGLANSTQTYISQNQKLDKFKDNTLVAKLNVGTVVSESVDWIDGNCSNPSPGTYNCPTTAFSVVPSCTASRLVGAATQSDGCSMSTASTITNIQIFCSDEASSAFDAEIDLRCTKQGADYNEEIEVVGSFKGVVRSDISGGEARLESCDYSHVTSGSPVITNASGMCDWIDTITDVSCNGAGGSCNRITFDKSFENPPVCKAQCVDDGCANSGSRITCQPGETTSTYTEIFCANGAGTNFNVPVNVTCHGK